MVRAPRPAGSPRVSRGEPALGGDRSSRSSRRIAEVIAFAVGRPRRLALDEILAHPTAQAG